MGLSIVLLPTEILAECFSLITPSAFVPGPLPIGSGDPGHEYFLYRSTLAALCLASKRCNEVAYPLLYQSVIVRNDREVVSLFFTLLVDFYLPTPKAGRAIRYFACLNTLGHHHTGIKELFARYKDNLTTRSYPSKAQRPKQKFLDHILDEIDSDKDPERLGMLFRLLAYILRYAPGIQDVLLQVPDNDYTPQDEGMGELLIALNSLSATVRLQCDPTIIDWAAIRRNHTSFDAISRGHEHMILGTRLDFLDVFLHTSVAHLEFIHDCGRWVWLFGRHVSHHNDDRNDSGWTIFEREHDEAANASLRLNTVQDLRLYDSRSAPFWIDRLLRYSPNLKSFTWTFCPHDWMKSYTFQDLGRLKPSMKVNEALLAGADKIERLTIECTEGICGPVTCLAAYNKLRHLTIDLPTLFYNPDNSESSLISEELQELSLGRLIPPSVETLELIEKSFILATMEVTAGNRDQILSALFTNLAEDRRAGTLPNIRRVTFRALPSPGASPDNALGHASQIQEWQGVLKRASVELIWAWQHTSEVREPEELQADDDWVYDDYDDLLGIYSPRRSFQANTRISLMAMLRSQ
ncbi:hypothetical protein BKA67DRAFT_658388 [Truncatella angustata]|uniref:Uncharacterized protein n=1 Tax=Truncatella angustata TaxID=152316 RepID=A0A9P8UKR0_9PEZI|nr:uncharacterized protein BKA67DRAFT_658388 [Truncatella angustata]KAH6654057.1 hypothetical protein BKA67DRAFT_658388 [Truncatella angustata]